MEMIKMIKPDWIENYHRYLETEITNRNFLTKKDRRIDDLEILAANRIMDEVILTEGENINLWKINVMQYTTAITLLARHGRLREKKNVRAKRKTPGWILNTENRINAIRRKISHVTLILKCVDVNNMTRKQSNIRRKLKRMYGSIRASRLEEVEANLEHELAVESKKLRDKKIIAERQRINTLFNINTKSVFREFRKDKKIDVAEPPPKEEVKQFWNDIWSKEGQFNSEAKWVTELRKGYCQNVRPTVRRIKLEHFNKINANLKDGNSPGRDLIVGYWIKKNISLRQPTFDIYQNINNNSSV